MRTLRGGGRAIVAAVAVAALVAPTAAFAQTPGTPNVAGAADVAAGWLAGQFVDDERIETTFDGVTYPDHGVTADALLALAGAGSAGHTIENATNWLAAEVGTYTGDGEGDAYAGATAKLAVVAGATGRDATDFGGRDLVAQLLDLEADSGRFEDRSLWGDWSNVLSQSLAVIALERTTDAGPSAAAVDYLADAACPDGGFPVAFGGACTPSADATGFAVQALLAAGEQDAAGAAVQWLLRTQSAQGSFGSPDAAANANSTGLAGVALRVAGQRAAADAAAGWLARAQLDCTTDDAGALPFAPAEPGDLTRATAQGLPGLTGVGLLTVTTDGVSDAPVEVVCTPFADVDFRSPHARPITELTAREVIEGYGDGTFRPGAAVTRAQLAALIGRAGGFTPATGPTDFPDVAASQAHAGWIQALADADVVRGFQDGTFRPGETVRRDQAAAILTRWLELAPREADAFTDLAANVHRRDINALAHVEVARGTGDGTYDPARLLQRDQIASLLFRALEFQDGA